MVHGKSIDEITSAIITAPDYIDIYIKELWKRAKKDLEPNATLDDLFILLKEQVWSFLDYYLVKQLIALFGDDKLKEEMAGYIVNIEHFKKRTQAIDLIQNWKGHRKRIPDYIIVEVKSAKRNLTIAELEKFREDMREYYFSSRVSDCATCMYYYDVTDGCFAISWLIHEEIAKLLVKNMRGKKNYPMFKTYGIIYIIVKGKIVYFDETQQGKLNY